MSHNTLYLLLTSILVGILLGILGATAAHYFRTGIYFIEQFIETKIEYISNGPGRDQLIHLK